MLCYDQRYFVVCYNTSVIATFSQTLYVLNTCGINETIEMTKFGMKNDRRI